MNNRIIKFRAWHKPYGYIVSPKVLNDLFEGKAIAVSRPTPIERIVDITNELTPSYMSMDSMIYRQPINIFTHKDFELMQYTGLKLNGKEVWEGDIVKAKIFGDLYKVIYKSAGFIFQSVEDPDRWIYGDSFEVIGNIYENPELLEEKNG